MVNLRGGPLTSAQEEVCQVFYKLWVDKCLVVGQEEVVTYKVTNRQTFTVTVKPCLLLPEEVDPNGIYLTLKDADGTEHHVSIFQVARIANGRDVHGEDEASGAVEGHNPRHLECSHLGTRNRCIFFEHIEGETRLVNLLREKFCGPNLIGVYRRRLRKPEPREMVLKPVGAVKTCVCWRLCVLWDCQKKVLEKNWGNVPISRQRCPKLGTGRHKRLQPCFLRYSPREELWPQQIITGNFSFLQLLPIRIFWHCFGALECFGPE